MIGVGSKVVFVGPWREAEKVARRKAAGVIYPVEGTVYTIRTIERGVYGGVYIRLNEIHNAPRHYSNGLGEDCFNLNRFRPVRDIKTDISIFQQIDREQFSKGKVDA